MNSWALVGWSAQGRVTEIKSGLEVVFTSWGTNKCAHRTRAIWTFNACGTSAKCRLCMHVNWQYFTKFLVAIMTFFAACWVFSTTEHTSGQVEIFLFFCVKKNIFKYVVWFFIFYDPFSSCQNCTSLLRCYAQTFTRFLRRQSQITQKKLLLKYRRRITQLKACLSFVTCSNINLFSIILQDK